MLHGAEILITILSTFRPDLPSGKQPHTYGKSPFFMGIQTINADVQ
jgi:hypothetical protein